MASDEVDTLDQASLDRFRIDLIKAGYEPVQPGSRRWRGPTAEPLKRLTSSPQMEIRILDGWPFRAPKLLIPTKDIVSEHVAANGEICLWREDDASGQWMTVDGVLERVDEWCEQQLAGFRPEDAMLDAHLYFAGTNRGLATLDIASLQIDARDPAGATDSIYGTWDTRKKVLTLSAKRPADRAIIAGRWYYHARPITAPPRDLEAFRAALTAGQRNNFDRRVKSVTTSGDPQITALLWSTPHGTNGLVLYLTRGSDGGVRAESLELAPSDNHTLMLRCGPDVELLQNKHITLFGAGSIGSHVALLLAEAGLGKLRLIDGDTMRPGNTVRHAALLSIGYNKANATALRISFAAPWTNTDTIDENPWAAARITDLIQNTDLVIDATGLARFTGLISRIATDTNRPLICTALYRAGAVARVRRQMPGSDVPIHERTDEARYPVIPPGDEPLALEPGCNAPVNNASPIAVASVAALTAEIAVDALSGALRYGEDTVEVYRPLDTPPFDRIGRLADA